MTFKKWQKLRKFNTRLLQPTLPKCSVDVRILLEQIMAEYFGEISQPPKIFFASIPFLAFIEISSDRTDRTIWLHDCLNTDATPDFVFSFILKHELLHTRIQPREINGKRTSHPPEFFTAEDSICEDEKILSWSWLYITFGDALSRDAECECIWVSNRKMKRILKVIATAKTSWLPR